MEISACVAYMRSRPFAVSTVVVAVVSVVAALLSLIDDACYYCLMFMLRGYNSAQSTYSPRSP